MRIISKIFSEHPASVGETYLEHMGTALGFGFRMLAGGSACLIHALVPRLFVSNGSEQVRFLHQRMIAHRNRQADAAAPCVPVEPSGGS